MLTKQIWGEIIKDFQEKDFPKIIERKIEYPLKTPLKRAVVLIGPRRAGKTYSMFQAMKKLLDEGISKKRMLYVNLEDSRLAAATIQDLNDLIETFFEIYPENGAEKIWVFLDEIQIIEKWDIFIRRLLDQENCHVFITGSSSKLMSKEIATAMRGRSLTYSIYPFSFTEFLEAKNIKQEKYLSLSEKAAVIRNLGEYLEYGGYPEAVVYSEERERIMREIIDVTIYRDIIERHKIKNPKVLRIFFTALFNSKEFSVHKFFNFLKSQGIKVSKNTLYAYFEYFCDSMVVFPLKKFSFSYKEADGSFQKVYMVDNGLLHSQGIRDYGRLMENMVFMELKRGFGESLSYYRSLDGKEVDFVVSDGKKPEQLIQACYDIRDFNTRDREIKGLLKASEELKCNNLLVITWDYESEEKAGGKKIIFKPLWKWILNM